jgi:hypothetical protein
MATAGPSDPRPGLPPTEAAAGGGAITATAVPGAAHSRRRRALTFVTVGLAVLVLGERLARRQQLGVAVALAGVVLLAAG